MKVQLMGIDLEKPCMVMTSELEPPAAPLRVLIAEDDPFTLTILQKRIAIGGYNVATATNGAQGLRMVEEFKPDLILSDWMMPELDGREFCRQIKDNPATRSIYFILLTARDKHEDKISALDTGADEYLIKPCDGQELMARLRAAERILRLQQELSASNGKLQQALHRINLELEATSRIQRAMLPQHLPVIDGYSFAAHYQPSTECSGDFYDLIPLPDGQLGVVIGDVSGHGAPAMVTMALTHLLLQQEAPRRSSPADLLAAINNQMCAHLATEQYLTMFYGILNLYTGELVYSSSGHNPPLQIDYSRPTFDFLDGCAGFPIKLIGPDMVYDNQKITIEHGQHLLLYTDGLLEAINPSDELYGQAGLLRSLGQCVDHHPAGMVKTVLADLNHYLQGQMPEDDLSLLIIHRA
jgi:serine phosphatase RsbU (regulator of sigma subunit)